MRRGDRACGFRRARQVGGIDRVDAFAGQRIGDGRGLRATGIRERNVGLPLKAVRRVPGRFAVANQQQLAQRRDFFLAGPAFFLGDSK